MQVPMMVSLALLGTLSAVGGRASHPAHPAGGPHPRWNAGDGSALRRGGAGAAGIGSSREPLRLRGGAGVRPSSAPTRSGGLLRLRGGVSKYYNQTAPSKRGGVFEEVRGGVEFDQGQSEWNKGGYHWEEKDFTIWCQRRLATLLDELNGADNAEGGGLHFFNVTGVKGHAVVTFRNGKKVAGVNWDQVSWSWRVGSSGARGTVGIKEFYSDFPDEVVSSVVVADKGDGTSGDATALRLKVGASLGAIPQLLERLVDEMMGHKSQPNINPPPKPPPQHTPVETQPTVAPPPTPQTPPALVGVEALD